MSPTLTKATQPASTALSRRWATIGVFLVFASFIPGGSILSNINRAFGTAQESVAGSSLPREQKGSISNALKTKHDTAKNAVNNIR